MAEKWDLRVKKRHDKAKRTILGLRPRNSDGSRANRRIVSSKGHFIAVALNTVNGGDSYDGETILVGTNAGTSERHGYKVHDEITITLSAGEKADDKVIAYIRNKLTNAFGPHRSYNYEKPEPGGPPWAHSYYWGWAV